jgi:DNA modification methylase
LETLSTAASAQLKIRRVALASLHLDPSNARLHGEENLASIAASLRRFGQAEPLVVHKPTGRVIGGNGRLVAMKKLGWTECDVVELDIDEITATALAIALNRSAESAAWDPKVLSRLLLQLQAEDSLEGVGFDEKAIDELLADLAKLEPPRELDDPGAGELPEKPVSRVGDLWILGDHRLLCGDSTNADDMARLMAGEKAVLLATDPPYLVDYQGGNHPQSWSNRPEVRDKHWDDYVDPKSGREFFAAFLRVALAHCTERVPVYQWHATRRQVIVEEAWKENGLLVHQTIIWVKARPVLTRCHFMWQHEPCFYGWREGFMPDDTRRPPPNQRTVWEIDQIGELDGVHPTQKPTALFEKPIAFHTRPGEVVLEPFSGSGTQLIAAERLGRKCRAMEIAPAYVDVAIRRWEQACAKQAVLEGDGRTFEAVSKERGDGKALV